MNLFIDSLKWNPNNLTYIFIWIILAVFLFFISHLLLRFLRSLRRTKTILKKLTPYERNSIDMQSRQDLYEYFSSHPIAKSIWHEFDESLVIIQGDKKVHNTIDASFFFNSESLGSNFIDSRLISSVPGLLTALGVLGTFFGLSKGLAGVNLSSDDITLMKDGIGLLLAGAGTAFMTSLWGVGLSFAYNLIEKLFDRQLQSIIKLLQDKIDDLFPRLTAEHQLQQIVDHGRESRTALQGLAEQIGNKMQETMITAADTMGQAVATTLEKTLGGALDRLNGGNEESMGSLIQEFMVKFESIATAPSEDLKIAAEENKATFNTFSQNMTTFIENIDKRMVTQEERDINRNESLNKVVRDISEQSQMSNNKLREAVDELISKLGTEVSNAISEIASEDLKRSEAKQNETQRVDQLITGQTSKIEQLLNQSETLNESVGKIGEANYKAAEELNNASIKINQTSSEFKQAGISISSGVSNLGDIITNTGQVIESISNTNKESIERLEEVQHKFESQYDALNEVVLVINKLSIAAENTFEGLTEKQKEFLNSLQNEVGDLTSKISKFLFDYTAEVQNQTNNRMNEWNEQTRQYTGQMKDVVDSISSIVDEIDGKISGVSN